MIRSHTERRIAAMQDVKVIWDRTVRLLPREAVGVDREVLAADAGEMELAVAFDLGGRPEPAGGRLVDFLPEAVYKGVSSLRALPGPITGHLAEARSQCCDRKGCSAGRTRGRHLASSPSVHNESSRLLDHPLQDSGYILSIPA